MLWKVMLVHIPRSLRKADVVEAINGTATHWQKQRMRGRQRYRIRDLDS